MRGLCGRKIYRTNVVNVGSAMNSTRKVKIPSLSETI